MAAFNRLHTFLELLSPSWAQGINISRICYSNDSRGITLPLQCICVYPITVASAMGRLSREHIFALMNKVAWVCCDAHACNWFSHLHVIASRHPLKSQSTIRFTCSAFCSIHMWAYLAYIYWNHAEHQCALFWDVF